MQSTMLRTSAFGTTTRPAACRRGALVVRNVQEVKGVVVSTQMKGTVVVEAERRAQDKTYQVLKKVTKRYMADSSNMEIEVGDFVRLAGTRPLSKTKRFAVAEVLRKAD